MTPVERMARAIYDACNEYQPWDKTRLYYEHKARAALAALREPSGAMRDECADAYGDCIHGFDTTWKVAIGVLLGVSDPIAFAVCDDDEARDWIAAAKEST